MRQAISTLAARRQANMGTFFVLSGNVRDVFLDAKAEQTSFLAIADLLRRQFPEHALVELTLSRGLACDDPEKLKSVMTAISPPKADEGNQPSNEIADLLRQAEAQSGQRSPGDDGTIASFAEAVMAMRVIWKQRAAKVLLLAPRLESLLQNSQNSPIAAALADAILDLAAKSLSPDTCPHLFVGLASSTEELPSLMRDTASGITILGVGLPHEAERAEIISALAISDETSSARRMGRKSFGEFRFSTLGSRFSKSLRPPRTDHRPPHAAVPLGTVFCSAESFPAPLDKPRYIC